MKGLTVKDIFELRKQGRIEEAYDAIRPMYAIHKGRYTSLCIFWTAADVFKLRLEQNRIDEAEKILLALKRMLPRVEEINEELDSKKTSTAQKAETKADDAKLPWETNDSQSNCDSAARFIQYAERRLNGTQKEPAIINCQLSIVNSSDFLNKGQQAVLSAIRENPGFRVPKIEEVTNIPSKSIERHISVLIGRGLIEYRGSKKTGGYYAI